MDQDPSAKPAECIPPLSGVCPICRVGPGDLPSRRFFEALKHAGPMFASSLPAPGDAASASPAVQARVHAAVPSFPGRRRTADDPGD